jgi:apolipoprotein D and lipocalin family protein
MNMKILALPILLIFSVICFANSSRIEPQTVSKVELEKYAGTWYEISRYPNGFQKDCAGNVRAIYTLQDDGKVRVVNECSMVNGKTKTAKGRAKIVDRVTNAKLKVTFFWPFYGDYWILDLDPEYRFAVIGEPKRKYLWILSRTPELPAETYSGILSRLQQQGYDTTRLVLTRQGN